MFTYILYGATAALLILSLAKDRRKTKIALKKAWKSFENILPQLLAIFLMIGLLLAVLSPKTISNLIGEQSGALGFALSGAIGSITLMPAFVAFPLAASLLDNGAGLTQIALFVSTLMMVGVLTFPVERKFFGRRIALARNLLALGASVLAALVIGGVLA